MRVRGIAAAAGVLALAAGAPVLAQTEGESRQTASAGLTTDEPGAPTGSRLAIDFRNPANPEGKPHTVRRIVVRLSPGSVIDTSVPVRCTASDEELLARARTPARPRAS